MHRDSFYVVSCPQILSEAPEVGPLEPMYDPDGTPRIDEAVAKNLRLQPRLGEVVEKHQPVARQCRASKNQIVPSGRAESNHAGSGQSLSTAVLNSWRSAIGFASACWPMAA